MPRAAEDLAPAQVPVLSGSAGHDEPAEDALTQRTALVWTDVAQCEELAADVEDTDRAALQRQDSAVASRDGLRGRDGVPQPVFSAKAVERETPESP